MSEHFFRAAVVVMICCAVTGAGLVHFILTGGLLGAWICSALVVYNYALLHSMFHWKGW